MGLSLTSPSSAPMMADLLTGDISTKAYPGGVCPVMVFWSISWCFSTIPPMIPYLLSLKNPILLSPKPANIQRKGILVFAIWKNGVSSSRDSRL